MIRALMVILVVVIAVLGVQSWRLNTAQSKIDTQKTTIADQGKKLTQKNGQLIALSILTETSSRAQTRLYAAAEQNRTLLRARLRTIEELRRENEEFRRWSDTPLPDAVVRMRRRPAITGGESYREWMSQNHPVPPGTVSPAQ